MKVLKFIAVLLLAVGMFSTTAIAQDDCTTAVPVPGGLDPCNDTIPAAVPMGGCAASSTSLNDMWLTFVAPSTIARVRTDVTPSTGTDSDYLVYSAPVVSPCANLTEIGCSEDEGAGFLGNKCIGGLTPGDTYYVRLGAWASETSTYCAYGPQYCNYLGSCGDYNVTIQIGNGPCGDGIKNCDGTEECEPPDGVHCDSLCQWICGDGVVQSGEQCDPPGPCCSATCQNVVICGNGCREGAEQCDDGNLIDGDGCSATCLLPVCGDGIVDVGEDCDPPGSLGAPCSAGGSCNSICKCIGGIPAVSEWGLAVLTLIGLVSGTILFGRRRQAVR